MEPSDVRILNIFVKKGLKCVRIIVMEEDIARMVTVNVFKDSQGLIVRNRPFE